MLVRFVFDGDAVPVTLLPGDGAVFQPMSVFEPATRISRVVDVALDTTRIRGTFSLALMLRTRRLLRIVSAELTAEGPLRRSMGGACPGEWYRSAVKPTETPAPEVVSNYSWQTWRSSILPTESSLGQTFDMCWRPEYMPPSTGSYNLTITLYLRGPTKFVDVIDDYGQAERFETIQSGKMAVIPLKRKSLRIEGGLAKVFTVRFRSLQSVTSGVLTMNATALVKVIQDKSGTFTCGDTMYQPRIRHGQKYELRVSPQLWGSERGAHKYSLCFAAQQIPALMEANLTAALRLVFAQQIHWSVDAKVAGLKEIRYEANGLAVNLIFSAKSLPTISMHFSSPQLVTSAVLTVKAPQLVATFPISCAVVSALRWARLFAPVAAFAALVALLVLIGRCCIGCGEKQINISLPHILALSPPSAVTNLNTDINRHIFVQ